MNRLVKAAALSVCVAVPLPSSAREEKPAACPNLMDAERLVLVLAPTFESVSAKVRLYERGDKAWKAAGEAKPAVLGKNGMAWAWNHSQYASGQPVKIEGDRRSPAGFFTLGRPFGLSPGLAGYMRLEPSQHYCVDDPASPHYNTVLPKANAGEASGEDMGLEPLYRQGLFVDYPTSAAHRGGSCIFVHVRRAQTAGTAGCVAMAEDDVRELQQWSAGKKTAIGILPESAWKTLRSCFPGI
jgi:L,D-peptidoglycan transpeptidase YkuD (ErfK/YbiS/YcfS/YnhG family)